MHRFFIVFLVASVTSQVFAAAESDPLFASNEPFAITLTAPFEEIDSARDKEAEYTGSLSYIDAAGQQVVLDAAFQVRGNWRVDPGNCRYSQLWVDLRRSQLPGTIFENQNRLKLVVQCRQSDRYVEYIHKERQLYEIFSLLSDYYFDTRLLNVTYIDSDEEDSIRENVGFFIEHQNRLSDRFQMAENELHGVPRDELNASQSTLASFFMYFIGNTDFSLIEGPAGEECCHNSKLLKSDDGEYYPIPYDFDASGFVDASYAPDPQPSFNLRSNRSRLYRGFCTEPDVVSSIREKFLGLQDEIMAIVSDTTYISERSNRRNVSYAEDFFETLNDDRDFDRAIIRRCR